jgi:hypothetical protein
MEERISWIELFFKHLFFVVLIPCTIMPAGAEIPENKEVTL